MFLRKDFHPPLLKITSFSPFSWKRDKFELGIINLYPPIIINLEYDSSVENLFTKKSYLLQPVSPVYKPYSVDELKDF